MIATEIDFAELEDGFLVELIENPDGRTRTLLAVFKSAAFKPLGHSSARGL